MDFCSVSSGLVIQWTTFILSVCVSPTIYLSVACVPLFVAVSLPISLILGKLPCQPHQSMTSLYEVDLTQPMKYLVKPSEPAALESLAVTWYQGSLAECSMIPFLVCSPRCLRLVKFSLSLASWTFQTGSERLQTDTPQSI